MESVVTTVQPAETVVNPDTQRAVLYNALSPQKLELTLFPTEQCNFRCTYCYEDFSIGRMSRRTIDAIKKLLTLRSGDLRHLNISWFGGEPLVAYDIVKEITFFASDLAKANDFAFFSGITTNGYALNDKRIDELHQAGIRKYQISLDGEGVSHDQTRLRIDGKGTFEKIWANILLIEKMASQGLLPDIKVMLRIHIHPNNVESVIKLADLIKANLSSSVFTILLKEVGHYGGANDKDIAIFHKQDVHYLKTKRELYASLSEYKMELTGDQVYVCYAGKANAFTIRADGSVGKCTVALKSSRNNIGNILDDGQLNLDAERSGLWLHALSSMRISDLSCPVGNLPALN